MICHVVLYRMKLGFTEADEVRLIDEAQRRLPLLPGVKNLRAGKNIKSAENGYSVALTMDFEDDAALEAYRVHPDHQFFVRQIAGPLVSEIWRYDFRWE
ncbi:MAG: Dabb family protein [Terriglobia bacterium]